MTDNYFTTPTREEDELSRRIRRQNVTEAIGVIAVLVLFVILSYICIVASPDQASAECDLAAEAAK